MFTGSPTSTTWKHFGHHAAASGTKSFRIGLHRQWTGGTHCPMIRQRQVIRAHGLSGIRASEEST
jgi:hypothetical protein